MHQPPTQKFLPLFSRTCVSHPLRTSPHHAWHPVSLPLQEKPIALWAPNALEPPVPDDFSEHILWTCLTTWDIQKPAKVSIHSLPKTTRWNNLGEYKHQHQVPIIRYCPCSNMLVNLFSAVQLLPHRLLVLPHRNQLLLLQQEKLTVSQYFALHIDEIGHYLCKLVPAFASVKSPKGVPEQATEPWWKPQPGPHSTAAYTMVHAPLLFRCCSSSSMLVNRFYSCSTTTTSPPGSIASKSTSPSTTSKASGFTDFCLTHRWNRALLMQTDPSFRLNEESQRNPRTSTRTLVETPAWTSFKCRLHHGTCSSPLLWYKCKQVAGLA